MLVRHVKCKVINSIFVTSNVIDGHHDFALFCNILFSLICLITNRIVLKHFCLESLICSVTCSF